jgi:hypothetical protein
MSKNSSIITPDILVKYIEYLIDLSKLLDSQEIFGEEGYNQLNIELELFHKRLRESDNIPIGLKTELLKIKLPPSKNEYSLWNVIKEFNSNRPKNYNKYEYSLRHNLKRFIDNMTNIHHILLLKK